MNLSERLKAAVEGGFITLTELANRSGVKLSTVGEIYYGRTKSPRFEHGVKLARVLDEVEANRLIASDHDDARAMAAAERHEKGAA